MSDDTVRAMAREEWTNYDEFKANAKLDDPILEAFEIYADALIIRLAAALMEQTEYTEAALHWLASLQQDYDANGNGIRTWSAVYDECVANVKRLAACGAEDEQS